MGRPHEAEGKKKEVVRLYQRLERGRSAPLATFVAHWPGGDDDEELKRAAMGARGPWGDVSGDVGGVDEAT